MSLDYRTVVLGGFNLLCVCAMLAGFLWRQNRDRFVGLGWFAAGFSLMSLGMGLMALRGTIPVFFSVVMVNGLAYLGFIWGLEGLEGFLGRPSSRGKTLLLWALFLSLIIYYTYGEPSTPIRIVCFSSFLIYLSWRYIRLSIFDADRQSRGLTLGIGLIFSVYLLLGVVRIVATILLYDRGHFLDLPSGIVEVFFGYANQSVIVLWAYSLNLMVNKSLIMDLDRERKKFHSVFTGSPHAIALTRLADGVVVDANPGLSRMTGLGYGEVIGKTAQELGLWRSREQRDSMIRKIREDGMVRGMEINLKHSSGRDVIGSLSIDRVSVNGEGLLLSTIMDVTERRKMEKQIAKMANTDPLTGLLNRAAFSGRLDLAMKNAASTGDRLSLMFLDLDRFKPVNDDFGHAIGDVVLRQATERMTDRVGGEGIVGRIGGDEFMILLPHGEERAVEVGERIRAAMEMPFDIDGRSIGISCSVGIAIYPDHGSDEIELAKSADWAMYAVKRAGGNGVEVFGSDPSGKSIGMEGEWE